MPLSLDTNVAIDIMRGKRREVRECFERARMAGTEMVVSAVVLYELTHGVRRSARPEVQVKVLDQFLGELRIVELDAADAIVAGALRHELEHPGLPIGPADILIAGQAQNRGWTVVTDDVGHFGRVQNLPLVNWRVSDTPLSYQAIVARLSGGLEDE